MTMRATHQASPPRGTPSQTTDSVAKTKSATNADSPMPRLNNRRPMSRQRLVRETVSAMIDSSGTTAGSVNKSAESGAIAARMSGSIESNRSISRPANPANSRNESRITPWTGGGSFAAARGGLGRISSSRSIVELTAPSRNLAEHVGDAHAPGGKGRDQAAQNRRHDSHRRAPPKRVVVDIEFAEKPDRNRHAADNPIHKPPDRHRADLAADESDQERFAENQHENLPRLKTEHLHDRHLFLPFAHADAVGNRHNEHDDRDDGRRKQSAHRPEDVFVSIEERCDCRRRHFDLDRRRREPSRPADDFGILFVAGLVGEPCPEQVHRFLGQGMSLTFGQLVCI